MLQLAIGTATDTGPKPRNEDALAAIEPPAGFEASKGWLLALADGVSQSADGKLAAQATVRGLVSDYYATPDTWEPAHAIDRIVSAQNLWLNGQAGSGVPLATTLSALVLRGRRFTLAHVGDCRVYRMQGGRFEQLSEDHVWQHEGFQHVLKRAVGLDKHVVLDFRDGELAEGDVFALLCDGVWEVLGDVEVHRLLQLHDEPQRAAEALVAAALAANAQDNVSAIVLRVLALPGSGLRDEFASAPALAVLPRLKPGQQVAGFMVEKLLAESRASLVYLVRDAQGQRAVLKTLTELAGADEELSQGLLTEGWLMKRVGSHYLPELIEPQERQWLMLAMRWYPGETLGDKLARGERISAVEAVRIGLRLSRALSGLHRLDILHRDIKPENLHLDPEGRLRLLDLGVAHCPGITVEGDATPGTASFLAPEQFGGARASVQTDLYAAGVTLYHALTRRYPYGEIEPFQTPHFGDPIPPTRYRPDIPAWLESVLLKAVARDPALRFETADEMRVALELGEARPLRVARKSPLAQRAPGRLWMALALASLGLNLLLLFVLLVSSAADPHKNPSRADGASHSSLAAKRS
ncbi:bifunctional protein-serine/threonine kinase/phosphatase [Chitinimonas taiwanensis]|uniref:bifunctional protein-serine/threonine kinase/phosphatase n=1 Tax=Chitinimonas taiwanensis TaxID=240412 RepID=UPI0035B0FF21